MDENHNTNSNNKIKLNTKINNEIYFNEHEIIEIFFNSIKSKILSL